MARTSANSSGEYRLAVYPEGKSFDLAASSGDGGAWQTNLQLRPGERRQLDLDAGESTGISGTVTARDNSSPLAFVSVQLVRPASEAPAPDGTVPRPPRVVDATFTDEKGRFRFANVKPGPFQIRCQVPGKLIYHKDPVTIEPGSPSLPGGQADATQAGRADGRQRPSIDFRLAPFRKGTWKSFGFLDRLAHEEVRDIHIDPDGTMWFATAGGVSRYDGKGFISYTKEDGLAHNHISVAARGPDGAMWFGTEGGVSRFDSSAEPGSARKWQSFTTADGLARDNVVSIAFDAAGSAWFGTGGGSVYGSGNGLSRYDGNRWTSFTPAQGVPHYDVHALVWDPKGLLWLGTHAGVGQYDGKEFNAKITKADGLLHDGVHSLFREGDGTLWIGAHRVVSRYGPTADSAGAQVLTHLTVKEGFVPDVANALLRDSRGIYGSARTAWACSATTARLGPVHASRWLGWRRDLRAA